MQSNGISVSGSTAIPWEIGTLPRIPSDGRMKSLFGQQDFVDGFFQGFLRKGAPCHLGLAFHRNEKQCGDGLDAEIGGQFPLLFGIDFVNVDFPFVFGSQFFQNRGNHFTGTTPGSIKVDDARFVAQIVPSIGLGFVVDDFFQKFGLGQMDGLFRLGGFRRTSLFLVVSGNGLSGLVPASGNKDPGQGYGQELFHCVVFFFPTGAGSGKGTKQQIYGN